MQKNSPPYRSQPMNPSNIIQQAAHKLTCLDFILDISNKKENYIPALQAQPWAHIPLSHGIPGLIVLFAEMDHHFPHAKWDQKTHQMVERLVQEIEAEGIQ